MMAKGTTESDYERLLAQERLILGATEAIVRLLEEQGVSRQELARRLGKSKGFVSQLLSGERNMTLRTLADLGHALGRSFSVVPSSAPRATLDAHRIRTFFGEFPTTGEARRWISPQVVEERLRAVEEISAASHEYELAA
jgi:transcriptional regulator with XRE-family HTH domain